MHFGHTWTHYQETHSLQTKQNGFWWTLCERIWKVIAWQMRLKTWENCLHVRNEFFYFHENAYHQNNMPFHLYKMNTTFSSCTRNSANREIGRRKNVPSTDFKSNIPSKIVPFLFRLLFLFVYLWYVLNRVNKVE